MSTHEEIPETGPQFHIVHLLVVMLVVAVIAGIMAPLARNFTPGEWTLIGTALLSILLGGVLFCVVVLFPRYIAQRRSGLLLQNLDNSVGWSNFIALLRLSFFGWTMSTLTVFSGLWNRSFLTSYPPTDYELLQVASLFIATTLVFGYGIFPFPHPQLRENGVLWGAFFTPWEKLTVRWSRRNPQILEISAATLWQFPVEWNQRAKVAAIIKKYCLDFIDETHH
ncbi:hypothetical protein LOC68_22665 [Blastopirellula sp. JC732]|uniref:Uncharacterized protein n=1 Tax=Blastopirellula sediminis TaxID=2894196 RepID=A0A9X1MRU1_9BACT|nr:hypothetical protein [Blastopirellula sediminis]MCC9605495.1 hypothetical protein [Blastopirellula sediminis]MCC9631205.1 hypothetical protein [Blastopirellula sediminis]